MRRTVEICSCQITLIFSVCLIYIKTHRFSPAEKKSRFYMKAPAPSAEAGSKWIKKSSPVSVWQSLRSFLWLQASQNQFPISLFQSSSVPGWISVCIPVLLHFWMFLYFSEYRSAFWIFLPSPFSFSYFYEKVISTFL